MHSCNPTTQEAEGSKLSSEALSETMVVDTINPRREDLCEFKVNLVCRVSSRPVRATHLTLSQQTNQNKRKKKQKEIKKKTLVNCKHN